MQIMVGEHPCLNRKKIVVDLFSDIFLKYLLKMPIMLKRFTVFTVVVSFLCLDNNSRYKGIVY